MNSSPASRADRPLATRARIAAVIVLSLLGAASAFDADYFRGGEQRPDFEAAWAPLDPVYISFLKDAARFTRNGENVLVILESPSGHPYFYAMYELSGRVVLAANSRSGKNTGFVKYADVLVIWPEGFAVPAEFAVTYRGSGGAVARRRP